MENKIQIQEKSYIKKINKLIFLFLILLTIPLRSVIAAQLSSESKPIGKGLAGANSTDLSRLDASWYYTWGACPIDPACVPMSRNGDDPFLPKNYNGYLLVGNEPTNIEPYGHPMTPVEGADIYSTLLVSYPNAKFILGGISAWDSVYFGTWLIDLKSEIIRRGLPLPYAWHSHGYVESWITVNLLEEWWTAQHAAVGGTFWITEWADTTGNINNNKILYQWMSTQPWIERTAYFTVRARGDESWWPSGWNTQLVDWESGTLTVLGEWFISAGHDNLIYLPWIKS